MKTVFSIFILIQIVTASFAQRYSMKIDSLSKNYIKRLTKEDQNKFRKIVKQRAAVNLFQRIDTTNFDYVFVEENYCFGDSVSQIHERYFWETDRKRYPFLQNDSIKFNDVLPGLYYINGLRQEVNYHYFSSSIAGVIFSEAFENYYTLDTLLLEFSNLKQVQKTTYDNTQASFDISDTSSTVRLSHEKLLIKKLKSTYQILTMLDKIHNIIIVSVQLPDEKPEVKLRYVNLTHYDW